MILWVTETPYRCPYIIALNFIDIRHNPESSIDEWHRTGIIIGVSWLVYRHWWREAYYEIYKPWCYRCLFMQRVYSRLVLRARPLRPHTYRHTSIRVERPVIALKNYSIMSSIKETAAIGTGEHDLDVVQEIILDHNVSYWWRCLKKAKYEI